MANNLVKAVTNRDIKKLIGQPALTNYYLVQIGGLKGNLRNHINNNGRLKDKTFWSNTLGLLCSEASLPTSSYATAEVKDNFIGVTQEFAHTRLYADSDFTFYVDRNYESIKFFEAWMDFISGRGPAQSAASNYFRRMNYPDDYKVSEIKITKFERDIKSRLQYQFINAFPKGMTSIPVAYGAADLLKVTVSFNYDRYVVQETNIPDVTVDDGGLEGEEISNAIRINNAPTGTEPGTNLFDQLPR